MFLANATDTGKYFEDVEEFWCQFLSHLFLNANEPSLLRAEPIAHSYRFVWEGGLIAFGPVLIRLDIEPNGSGVISTCIFEKIYHKSDQDGYSEHQYQVQNKQLNRVRKRTVHRFLRQIEKADFWDMPTSNLEMGADGHSWFLEGTRDGQFHFVERWMPHEKNFVKVGMLLVNLSRLRNQLKIIENVTFERKRLARRKFLLKFYMWRYRFKNWLNNFQSKKQP